MYSVSEIQRIVAPIAQRHGVERMTLFGSYARGENTPNSDIDLRIDRGSVRGLQMAFLLTDLEDALNTRVKTSTASYTHSYGTFTTLSMLLPGTGEILSWTLTKSCIEIPRDFHTTRVGELMDRVYAFAIPVFITTSMILSSDMRSPGAGWY
mgnify:CR=1 FL=1